LSKTLLDLKWKFESESALRPKEKNNENKKNKPKKNK